MSSLAAALLVLLASTPALPAEVDARVSSGRARPRGWKPRKGTSGAPGLRSAAS